MTWAGKRQAIILSVFILLAILVAVPLIFKAVPNPSCSDGKQNQNETGVDCGGSCQKICKQDATEPSVLWVRPFIVSNGVVSATAYIANPNPGIVAKGARYVMKIYDADGLLLAERMGSVDIPAKTSFPIFEGGIAIGSQKAKTAFFEFVGDVSWDKYEPKEKLDVSVSAPELKQEENPRIYASVRNNSSVALRNIPVVAIVYDTNGNAIASSQTMIEVLPRNESQDIVFTWLEPFTSTVGRIEIYPKVPLNP